MTVSVLRTADAWWLKTEAGAAKIDTTATTTGALLSNRAAIDAATRFATEIVSRPSHDRWRPALLDRAAD